MIQKVLKLQLIGDFSNTEITINPVFDTFDNRFYFIFQLANVVYHFVYFDTWYRNIQKLIFKYNTYNKIWICDNKIVQYDKSKSQCFLLTVLIVPIFVPNLFLDNDKKIIIKLDFDVSSYYNYILIVKKKKELFKSIEGNNWRVQRVK